MTDEYEEMLLDNLRKNEEIDSLMRECWAYVVGDEETRLEIRLLVKKTWLEATIQADIRNSIK